MAEAWLTRAKRDDHRQRLTYTDPGEPKGCLHTTEGSGWPTYQGFKVNPHLTVKPIPGKGIEARQHIPLNYASFALRNLAGGAQTNRDNVVQIELVGTSAKGGPGYFWPEADDAVLLALAELIAEISKARGIPLKALPFKAYPSSYGAGNGVRLSGAAFDAYSGWLGHQHVAENLHGDPGAFPWDRMVRLYAAAHKPAPKPAAAPSKPLGSIFRRAEKPFVLKRVLKVTTPRQTGLDVVKIRQLTGCQNPLWPVFDMNAYRAVVAWQVKMRRATGKDIATDGEFGPQCAALANIPFQK